MADQPGDFWRDPADAPDNATDLVLAVTLTCTCHSGMTAAVFGARVNGDWHINGFQSYRVDGWFPMPPHPALARKLVLN